MDEKERKQLAENIFNDSEKTMSYLVTRWRDEYEYEDWADYEKTMKDHLAKYPTVEVIKMTKKPFCIKYRLAGVTYQMGFKNDCYFYKRIK